MVHAVKEPEKFVPFYPALGCVAGAYVIISVYVTVNTLITPQVSRFEQPEQAASLNRSLARTGRHQRARQQAALRDTDLSQHQSTRAEMQQHVDRVEEKHKVARAEFQQQLSRVEDQMDDLQQAAQVRAD